jgi:hypothetical protein
MTTLNMYDQKRRNHYVKKAIKVPFDIAITAICVPLMVSVYVGSYPIRLWNQQTRKIAIY